MHNNVGKNGKWKFYKERNGNPIAGYDYDCGYLCSQCGFELPDGWYDDSDGYPNVKFCPECGACMLTDTSISVDSNLFILCKGKCVNDDTWVEGYFVKYQPCASKDDWVVGIVPSYASDLYLVSIIPETVGYFAGIKLHDILIFTGDILKDKYTGKIYKVVRDGYKFKLEGFQDSGYCISDDAFSERFYERFEWIGNIHDDINND